MAENVNVEISPEELKLLENFRKLGVRPKADTAEDLQGWIVSYGQAHEKIKEEPDREAEPVQTQRQPMTLRGNPRLSLFTGTPGRKEEATYDLWKYEVKCLLSEGSHDDDAIMEAIRRSLEGEPARVTMRLGPKTTISNLLQKFDSIYGAVDVRERVLAQFYSERQQQDETVSDWSCRLEDLLAKAVELGRLHPLEADETLRCMFWTGQKKELKDVSGHKFDRISTLDELRVAIRQIERDLQHYERHRGNTPKKPMQARMVKADPGDKQYETLEGMIKQLATKVDTMQKEWKSFAGTPNAPRQSMGSHPPPQWRRDQNPRPTRPVSSGGPTCWRCGEKGHVRSGCRVRLDHSRRELNGRRSADGGNL